MKKINVLLTLTMAIAVIPASAMQDLKERAQDYYEYAKEHAPDYCANAWDAANHAKEYVTNNPKKTMAALATAWAAYATYPIGIHFLAFAGYNTLEYAVTHPFTTTGTAGATYLMSDYIKAYFAKLYKKAEENRATVAGLASLAAYGAYANNPMLMKFLMLNCEVCRNSALGTWNFLYDNYPELADWLFQQRIIYASV